MNIQGDRDRDGDIDYQDLPPDYRRDMSDPTQTDYDEARERIYAKDPDSRDNVRELKRLRAQDALYERKLRREEAEYDRVIAEQDAYDRDQQRSPLERYARGALKGAASYLKPTPKEPVFPRPRQQPRYAPQTRGGRQPRQTRRPRYARGGDHYRPPTPPDNALGRRLDTMTRGLDRVGGGVSRVSSISTGGSLAAFSDSLLPSPQPRQQYHEPRQPRVRVSVTVGDPVPAVKKPRVNGLENFVGKNLGISGKKGKKVKGVSLF